MCYSALVNQHAKNLGLTYKARVQVDFFEDLFKDRAAGSGAKIPRAMEAAFLEKPKSAAELRIAKYIRDFHAREKKDAKAEISKQEKRLSDAEKSLKSKHTKKAENDVRIATAKIEKLTFKIERLESGKIGETDSRIYPGQYAPLITLEKGERDVRPFRYHLRPRGQGPEFDRKFDGNYNARRDRLEEVFWWKSVLGKNHGALAIKAFFENVPLSKFEHRKLKKGEEDKNLILKFEPKGLSEMLVPCLFDTNAEEDFTLHSFALITDDPNPEVAAAGHERTPVVMKETHLELWLEANQNFSEYRPVFEDKEPTYFEHQVSA
jgi:putative SOS response-associated peptidase YedK